MRRTILVPLAALAVGLLLGAGTALAQTITCPIEFCGGTAGNDVMQGSASPNKIHGQAGADLI